MRRRSNFRMLPKLIASFVVVAVLVVLVGVAGLTGLQATQAQLDAITSHVIPEIIHLKASESAVSEAMRNSRLAALSPADRSVAAHLRGEATAAETEALREFAALARLSQSTHETALIAQTRNDLRRLLVLDARVVHLDAIGQEAAVRLSLGEEQPVAQALLADFDTITQSSDDEITQATMRAGQAHHLAQAQLIAVSVLAGVLAVLFGVLTARAIARPVRAMQEAAERLATGTVADLARAMSALAIGDLNGAHAQVDLIPLDLHGRDEVGALATSFATMQGAIASIVISLDRAREGLRASRDMLVSRNEALVHEVTEREVTEAALRQSEERYRQMETHTPIGMSLQAPDGRYLRVNPALCALVGYSEEELLARTFLDITHPGDIDSGRGQLRGLLAGEISTYAAEKRYIHKGGAPVWVLLAVSLVRDEDGRPRYFISQVQDITERKLIEQALAQSKATAEELAHLRHQQAEEAEAMAAVGTALSSALDPGTVYRIILEQAARVLPFDHAAIALYRDGWVISVATLGGPDIAPETRLVPIDPSTSTWQMLTSGKPAHLADTEEVPGWTNPPPWRGTHRMRSMIVVPLLIDGALIGSFKVASFTPHFYTVTHIERAAAFGERATQAVRNARLYAAEKERTRIAEDLARLRQELVEEAEAMAAVSVALTSTLEPHVLYRVILEQVVRVLPCDLVNVKLFQEGWVTIVESWGDPASPTGTRIAPLDDTAAFWLPTLSTPCYLADTTQEPSWRDIPPHVDEYRVRSVITVPLVVDGVQLGAFDVCSMTPRFYSERHIRLAGAFGERVAQALHNARLYLAVRERSCAAEELARLRSDFVASVSHELRTPLTAIVGFSELLLARWEQFSEAQRMQRINHIVQAANRQQRLVEDLLLIGRIETASLAPKSEVLPLAPLVREAVAEVQVSYPGQHIMLQGPTDLHAYADARRTSQVLVNMLDNAAKYSPEGTPIAVIWAQEREMVVLRVVDQGIGMPTAGRDQLFTRFGRLPGSPIRAGRVGTGLGLHISRGLAEAMGGDLDLETTGPEGSTFRLRLPASA